MPLKQNGVLKHVRKNNVAIMGILETKLSQQRSEGIARKNLGFGMWQITSNTTQMEGSLFSRRKTE